VQGISDLITTHGMINVDFADVKAAMSERGMAMMGIGVGEGDNRAAEAARQAICSPLLEDIDISGAKGVLVNVTGSSTMTMDDYQVVANIIHEKVHEDANIFIGLVINEAMGERLQVTAIATGFGDAFDKRQQPHREPARPALAAITGSAQGNQSDMDVPAYIRNRDGAKPRPSRSGLAESEEYDIPAFLRRRVD
jgi:cell division protein FtsZ